MVQIIYYGRRKIVLIDETMAKVEKTWKTKTSKQKDGDQRKRAFRSAQQQQITKKIIHDISACDFIW